MDGRGTGVPKVIEAEADAISCFGEKKKSSHLSEVKLFKVTRVEKDVHMENT